MHPTINFTTEWSYRSVSFLDVKIALNKDGQLTMDLYTKPTNMHQYLHRQRCHLRHCKTTIAYITTIANSHLKPLFMMMQSFNKVI